MYIVLVFIIFLQFDINIGLKLPQEPNFLNINLTAKNFKKWKYRISIIVYYK